MLRIKRYTPEDSELWNRFLFTSKNGLFLFHRTYLSYHQDRFQDHSLLFFRNDQLIALLPAHEQEDALCSHRGLTFGGMVTDAKMKAPLMLDLMQLVIQYAKEQGWSKFLYNPIPSIYHQVPAEEDLYALARVGAEWKGGHLTSCVDYRSRLPFSSRRKRGLAKAEKSGMIARKGEALDEFYSELNSLLNKKHGVSPTHSLEELKWLKEQFPENIKLYECRLENEFLAGVLVYESSCVAHAQYIVSGKKGKEIGALDYLFNDLIDEVFSHKRFFDFGSSTVNQGRELNVGLVTQKEEFGGRSILQARYEVLL